MGGRRIALGFTALVLLWVGVTGVAQAAGSGLNPPSRLGSLGSAHALGGPVEKKFADRDARQVALLKQRVSGAYHGATSAAQIYRSADLADGAILMAVTAASPGLFVTDLPAADLALVKPVHDVMSVGSVQCLVANQPRVLGSPAVADETSVVRCQRTASGFTVMVDPMYGGPLTHDPKAVAALVNQAWGALHP